MGMYTELNIGVEFKENAPKEVIDTIHRVISNPRIDEPSWAWALSTCGSYYFDGKPYRVWGYDTILNSWFLTIRNNIKNYSGEIEGMLEYIAPCLESSGFIGYKRYEEDELPTLIFIKDGKVKYDR